MSIPDGIVWLPSFPKSGNTWFRIFLANLAVDGPADINNLGERGSIASARFEFEAVTLLDSGLLTHDDIDNLRPRVYEAITANLVGQRWIKVHDAYTRTTNGEPMFGTCSGCVAVYMVRDPRDVAVSLAYHNNIMFDDAIALINGPNSVLCNWRKGMVPQLRQKLHDWSTHVSSWLDQTEVPVHLLRYEDLLADPLTYFSAALSFAKRPATLAEIDRAMQNAEFTKLQRQENEKGFAERMSRTAPFFRSGGAGNWREKLTSDQIARIEEKNATVMQRLGYELFAPIAANPRMPAL